MYIKGKISQYFEENQKTIVFIGPESDHCLHLLMTQSVKSVSDAWDLTDVTLAVEDANSKLVNIVTFADADIQESVDSMLVAANSLATACHVRKQLDNSFSTVFVKT